jgi:hypothetical protein
MKSNLSMAKTTISLEGDEKGCGGFCEAMSSMPIGKT